MSKDYLITENSLVSIANEVRNLTGGKEQISISEIIHTLNNLEIAEKTSLPVLNANYPEDSSLTVISGQSTTADFLVVIDTPGKPAEYTYQWFENGIAIVGANSSVYSKVITTGGTFNYYCEITNEAGTVTSRVATLNVTLHKLPILNTNYPENVTQIEKSNGSASFTVKISTAGVPDDYTYQWYVNDSAVSGATSATYTKTGLTSVANYTIYCKVTNAAGSINSRTATLSVQSSQPSYTYSGSHELIKENTYNWKIKFKTSGTLRFSHLGNCDGTINAFLVGGGAGGAARQTTLVGGGGGGGGKTTTFDYSIASNKDYVITIGGGGSAAGGGGSTTAFGKTAAGGSSPAGNNSNGGNGGSGGGGAAANTNAAGKGGSDGSAGGTSYGTGGTGQSTTTREFGDSNGTLYAGGGGGGAGKDGSNASGTGAAGGNGGGGRGSGTGGNAQSGTTNTGGGGGGAGAGYSAVGSGGSGIVVIRNKR